MKNDMTIPNTIYQQLRHFGQIKMWRWGVSNLVGCGKERFLRFNVSGMKFKGFVKITLNFMDTYDIQFIKKSGEVEKEVSGVYFDEMVEVIDEYVEKVKEYKF
jgi:hypothetical protein